MADTTGQRSTTGIQQLCCSRPGSAAEHLVPAHPGHERSSPRSLDEGSTEVRIEGELIAEGIEQHRGIGTKEVELLGEVYTLPVGGLYVPNELFLPGGLHGGRDLGEDGGNGDRHRQALTSGEIRRQGEQYRGVPAPGEGNEARRPTQGFGEERIEHLEGRDHPAGHQWTHSRIAKG